MSERIVLSAVVGFLPLPLHFPTAAFNGNLVAYFAARMISVSCKLLYALQNHLLDNATHRL